MNRTFEEVGAVVGALVGLGQEIFAILEPNSELAIELAMVPVEVVPVVGSLDGMLDGVPVGDPGISVVPAVGPAAAGPKRGFVAGD